MDRRTFLSVCGLVGAKLACVTSNPSATDGGGRTNTLPIPPLDEGELVEGVRVFRLEARAGERDFVGVATRTWGYNGDFLGPTLRFTRGERVRVELANGLDEPTTLHFHGMHLPARTDGGPHSPVAPGAATSAEFDVEQPAATCWYHPHPMHATARHVYMGLAGIVVIEDPAQTIALPAIYGVDDLPLVLQDRRFAVDGTHPYSAGGSISMHDMMTGMKGTTILVNGAVAPRALVPRGLVRLRLLNGSNARFYNVGFADDRAFLQIASDGGLLPAAVETTRLVLSPGERAEILVDFGDDASGTAVALRSYSGEVVTDLFRGGANLADELDRGTFELLTFEVGTEQALVAPPTQLLPIERIAEVDAMRTRSITLEMRGGEVLINGTRMTELAQVPPEIEFRIPVGTTEVWSIANLSPMMHPLHLHNRHFQILDIDGALPPASLAGWKDTVLVEPGSTVRVIVPFTGTPDAAMPYMFHCHILEHEDHGMMGQFFLV